MFSDNPIHFPLLRCPAVSLPTVRLRHLPTTATRSGRFLRHRRRSHRSPLGRLGSPRTIREVLGDSLHTFSSVRKYDRDTTLNFHFYLLRNSLSTAQKGEALPLLFLIALYNGIREQISICSPVTGWGNCNLLAHSAWVLIPSFWDSSRETSLPYWGSPKIGKP